MHPKGSFLPYILVWLRLRSLRTKYDALPMREREREREYVCEAVGFISYSFDSFTTPTPQPLESSSPRRTETWRQVSLSMAEALALEFTSRTRTKPSGSPLPLGIQTTKPSKALTGSSSVSTLVWCWMNIPPKCVVIIPQLYFNPGWLT